MQQFWRKQRILKHVIQSTDTPQCDGNCIHLLPNLKPTTSDITVYNFFAAYSQSQILATSNIKEKLRTILTPQVSYYVETYYIK